MSEISGCIMKTTLKQYIYKSYNKDMSTYVLNPLDKIKFPYMNCALISKNKCLKIIKQ